MCIYIHVYRYIWICIMRSMVWYGISLAYHTGLRGRGDLQEMCFIIIIVITVIVWYGRVRYGTVWCGMVWHCISLVYYNIL